MGDDTGHHEFEVLGTREVFDGRILRLHVDTVSMPGGGTADREICDHDDAVAVVALDADGDLVLVRQYRHPVRDRLWELPAGLCDVDGEEPLETAERELEEEAGLLAGTWTEIVRIVPSPGFSTEHVTVFLATDLTEVGRPESEHEEADMEVDRLPLDEAVSAVLDGRIVNGIAVAGILATREHLRRTGAIDG